MCPPRRNDPDAPAALRPRDEQQPAIDLADRLPAPLAMVAPAVGPLDPQRIGEYPRRLGEVEAARLEIGRALALVPLEAHDQNYT